MARSRAKINSFLWFIYSYICCLHLHLNELVYFLCVAVVVVVVFVVIGSGGVFKPPMMHGPYEGP